MNKTERLTEIAERAVGANIFRIKRVLRPVWEQEYPDHSPAEALKKAAACLRKGGQGVLVDRLLSKWGKYI